MSTEIFFRSEQYTGPLPDASQIDPSCQLSEQGGSNVAKIAPDLVVKYGSFVTTTEAENLIFVGKYAEHMPVPQIHACYKIGPFDRDLADFGSQYDTYIIMDYVEGRRLDTVWNDLSEAVKTSIAKELGGYIYQLRSLSQEGDAFIGSVSRGPLPDPILERHHTRGPFASEEDFNSALVLVHENNMPKANLRHHLEGALAQHKHQVVFAHGDLSPRNIIIQDECISGIVDWEMSGWYPAYWDFVKCFNVWGWTKDWPYFVSTAMETWWCEWAVYDMIKRDLW